MEKINNAEKWELLKQAVEKARVRIGKEICSSDVLEEIPYARSQFSLQEIEEAIYLLTDNIPTSYRQLIDVAGRFLKRKATYAELREAVKESQNLNEYILFEGQECSSCKSLLSWAMITGKRGEKGHIVVCPYCGQKQEIPDEDVEP